MNTNRKSAGARRAAFVAAALFATVTAAGAGGQRHVMPADYGQTHPTYEFRIVNAPSAGAPFTVQLVNTATGQPVTDAHVTILRPTYLGIKAVPMIQNVAVPLQSDGHGGFIYSGERLQPGEQLRLRGHVPGESSAIWGTVQVNN